MQRSHCHGQPETVHRGETGSALLVTMAVGAFVSALAAALVAVVMIEDAVEANHRRGVQALYAADGLLASVVAELPRAPEGDAPAVTPGPVLAGPAVATLPDGSVVDADAETRALARGGRRPGDPGWRLVARGWLGDLAGAPDRVPRLYLLAWLRRGPADPDPSADATGHLLVRAAAFGPYRVRRAVEATLVRDVDTGLVRVATWNVVR